MYFRYECDPECLDVIQFYEMADDTIMEMSGCWGDFLADFERKHPKECERCEAFNSKEKR